jgi:hypothetical protein
MTSAFEVKRMKIDQAVLTSRINKEQRERELQATMDANLLLVGVNLRQPMYVNISTTIGLIGFETAQLAALVEENDI